MGMTKVLAGIALSGLVPAAVSAVPLASAPAAQESAIVRKITQIVVDKLGVETDQVVRSANFVSDLGADSLAVVELRMEKMVTVGDAINLVYGKGVQ
jgi:acyl carrier protein